MGTQLAVTYIKDLKLSMSNLSLVVIALDIGKPSFTKDNNEVRTLKVADKTGTVNLSLWNEPGKVLQPGDIIRMSRAYTGVFMNCMTVFLSKKGDFYKIGEFCMVFSELPFMSEPLSQEMAQQYEQEDMERKAQKAMRESQRSGDNQNNGANSGSRIVKTENINNNVISSQRGSSSNKTWGTQGGGNGGRGGNGGSGRGSHHGMGRGGQQGGGGMSQMGGNGGRGQHKNKEKR